MSKVTVDISISLDGYVAGPNPTLEEPLGRGGERLHEWVVSTESWRESHGLSGGETGVDADVLSEAIEKVGATIMGRKMFSGGAGPWADDPNPDGWWGDEPPFRHSVFVLTHHEREQVAKQGGTTFTFVTDGIEAALEQARAAAGDKNVAIAGGGSAIQQFLNAGLVDEMQIHVAPVLLGGGIRLFDDVQKAPFGLEYAGVVESPSVATFVYASLDKTTFSSATALTGLKTSCHAAVNAQRWEIHGAPVRTHRDPASGRPGVRAPSARSHGPRVRGHHRAAPRSVASRT